MEALTRGMWTGLSVQEKEKLLHGMIALCPAGMEYIGVRTFERFGQRTETGLFLHAGREFVFVPGDRVTLGWNQWQDGMNEETSADLSETVSEYGVEDVDSFLTSQMSPVREAAIAPMLVECQIQSLGWIEVTEEEALAVHGSEFAAELEKFKHSDLKGLEQYQAFRLERQGEKVRIQLYNEELTLEALLEEQANAGFSLLTEDEWEYLYGGGCRTLFPWGDSFDYTMKLKHFGRLEGLTEIVGESIETDLSLVEEDEIPYDLELPNFFGLQFAGDPYKVELTMNPSGEVLPKGGDGGGMICGGMGPLVGYLPAAAVYYRDSNANELEWEDWMDSMYYRRVIRLTDLT
ncbi:hypothetical protein ABEW19_27170 [Paenibacillus illinoisensis]|uniref:hypothetical protein n=1 Tax=Paenibacillus illinoisensis TaxID=59845 RepID=UPI000FDAD5CC|nr:hypothetical protein [Paenibacillus illinoisensis]